MATRHDPLRPQSGVEDDAALMRRVAAGDVPAQERLWRVHVTAVHRVCASQLDASDAEDATADTFLAAFRIAADYDPQRGSLQAWLLGIAVNQVRRRWRADRRVRAILDRAHDRARAGGHAAQDDHADAAIARVDTRHLRSTLALLTPSDRLVLVTQASGELTPQELGAALGVSPGAAKVRLHRARQRLRTLLETAPPHQTTRHDSTGDLA